MNGWKIFISLLKGEMGDVHSTKNNQGSQMINRIINGWKIIRSLGEGGMANVYYAENNLHKAAAIKVLKKKFSDEQEIHDRFKGEAEIMSKLDHPNILKVQNLGEIDGQPFILMDYLKGTTLRDKMMAKGKIDKSQLKKYFEQCRSALAYTHNKGIAHRDIKPSNIFITEEDNAIIMDFGIAKSKEVVSHTMTGQKLGTTLYMSPEQIKDPKRVNFKTDIYSLGVTFYQALTGALPYDYNNENDSEYSISKKILEGSPDFSNVDKEWTKILSECLQKNHTKRKEMSEIGFGDLNTFEDQPYNPDEETIFGEGKNQDGVPDEEGGGNRRVLIYFAAVLGLVIGGYFLRPLLEGDGNEEKQRVSITRVEPGTDTEETAPVTPNPKPTSDMDIVKILEEVFTTGLDKDERFELLDKYKPRIAKMSTGDLVVEHNGMLAPEGIVGVIHEAILADKKVYIGDKVRDKAGKLKYIEFKD